MGKVELTWVFSYSVRGISSFNERRYHRMNGDALYIEALHWVAVSHFQSFIWLIIDLTFIFVQDQLPSFSFIIAMQNMSLFHDQTLPMAWIQFSPDLIFPSACPRLNFAPPPRREGTEFCSVCLRD